MTGLTALWLPILLSAVFVFIASSIIHMLPLWHKRDYPALPNQDQVMDMLRPLAIPPGDYLMPRAANMKEMKTPEFMEKIKKGPVMMITVMPSEAMNMARNLTLWFIYCLVVSLFAGYVAGRALAPGADDLQVCRFAGTTAFVGYVLALWQMSIWYWRAWSMTLKSTFDGVIYALITGATFAWLWPR